MKNNDKRNFIVFIICYIAYTSIFFTRLNLSMASPGLVDQNIMTQEQIGILGSIFFVAYAVGRMIHGYIGDKMSPWIMVSVGLLIAGGSNLCIGFLPPFPAILLLWGTNAYAQSALWSSLLRVISEIYSYERAKKMMSYLVTSVAAGNIFGIILNTIFINRFGVRYAFVIPGGILILVGILAILILRQVPCSYEAVQKCHMPMRQLLKNKDLRTVLIPSLAHGMIKDNISLWMALFFVDRYDIDLNASAAFVLFIPLVGLVGRLAYPFLNRLYKQKEYQLCSHAYLLCGLVGALLLIKILPPIAAIICLSLIYAAVSIVNTFLLSCFPLQFTANGNQSSVSGILDFFSFVGAGIGSISYGYLVSAFGYSAMFLSYILVAVISIIIIKNKVKAEREVSSS